MSRTELHALTGMLIVLGSFGFNRAGAADDAPAEQRLANPFFAMNFTRQDPALAASPEAKAALLQELGYDGCQYLGPLEQLDASLVAMDKAGLVLSTAAVSGYNISVDPGTEYQTTLKEGIRRLKGYKTLFLIGFASKSYDRLSPEGDLRAVEVCQWRHWIEARTTSTSL